MPNAKDVDRNEGAKEKFLLIGDTGSGKTSQFLTLPGKKFIYCFDPSALNTLKGHDLEYEAFYPDLLPLGAQSLTKDKGETRKTGASKEPTTYVEWEKDFEKKLKEGFFDTVDVIGFDSFTTFSDIVMDRILWINGRHGQFPQQDDWGAQMATIRNVVRTLTGLDRLLFFTAHDELKQDEQTKRMLNVPMLTGRLRTKLPLLFSEIYHTECQSTADTIKYVVQTRPDRLNPKVRCTIRGLAMFEDVTIQNWDKPEESGLGAILRGLKRPDPGKRR